jgi:hypothetical protein
VEDYDGRQVVGMDLHRRRSVLVRMTEGRQAARHREDHEQPGGVAPGDRPGREGPEGRPGGHVRVVLGGGHNRADEVLGIAEDARQAGLHGVLPANLRRACIYMLEATPATQVPVRIGKPFGMPDPVFQARPASAGWRSCASGCVTPASISWSGRGITRSPVGFTEPSPAVGWDRFAAGLRAGFTAGEAVPAPR